MTPNGVKSGISEDNLESAAGCGIVVEYCPNVRLDMLKHHGSPLLGFPASCLQVRIRKVLAQPTISLYIYVCRELWLAQKSIFMSS